MTFAGVDEAIALLQAHADKGAQVLELDDGSAPVARPLAAAGFHVTTTRGGPALAAPETVDAAVCLEPTRIGPLIPTLQQLRAALVPDGVLVVSDLVWQTAPTPELLRAFPAPGREKVRPIEGWEMQAEHAGFDIVERRDVARDALMAALVGAQRDAVAADERGAAKLAVWALRKS